ncbi:hypothetical protein [Burkholderia thailandensis]|uniref:Copper chaperone n=1 Tax=Burkholderia thailandensis TaxID=57975 RepID=A0AAW9CZT0_BURTH|nr:hypothetical protein [Burkholderia thailandensis]AHI68281.1 hypothetical protein BTL_5478 [Burkholderia thailandensis H0587]AIP65672.1 hypothetical protein DR62_5278 [Burkholderia thailandensis]AOI54019.1 hypothetical protein WI24_19170 [Burkholderia thailandensis]AOJ53005.1 hypothetical protein AQ475_18990 [Burkholderia thailandensis]AVR28880.1 hypothetical protein A8H32_29295 [Burkholderia thailandensis]
MKFRTLEKLSVEDIPKIANAIISVDPDAKISTDVQTNTVDVDSWLFAEEFLVAFYDAGYDVRIAQR